MKNLTLNLLVTAILFVWIGAFVTRNSKKPANLSTKGIVQSSKQEGCIDGILFLMEKKAIDHTKFKDSAREISDFCDKEGN